LLRISTCCGVAPFFNLTTVGRRHSGVPLQTLICETASWTPRLSTVAHDIFSSVLRLFFSGVPILT